MQLNDDNICAANIKNEPQMPVISHRQLVLWGLAIGLAAIFTAFQIQSSLHNGVLSIPSTYDDVVYFNEALERLNLLYREGGRAFVKDLWVNTPHSPIQTFLALFGFGLFGPNRWAAVAMNVIPLSLITRLVLGYAFRQMRLAPAFILTTALLGYPIFGLLILEFRPDMMCALFTAAGAIIVAADRNWREGGKVAVAKVIALFVGALMAKPTLAPVTCFVFFVSLMMSAIFQSRSREETLRVVRLGLLCGGAGLLIVSPYYVINFSHLVRYVWGNAFGSSASLWATNFDWQTNALYYLTGAGGSPAIGRGWLFVGAIVLVVSGPICLSQWRKAISVACVFLAAYLSVTLPSMKSPYIGAVVPALVLGIIALLLIMLISRLRPTSAKVAALCLLVFSVFAWEPVLKMLWGQSLTGAQVININRIHNAATAAIAEIPNLDKRRLYFPVLAPYLNQDSIGLELRRRGLPVPIMPSLYEFDKIETQKYELDRSDIAVIFSDDCTMPMNWPPSTKIRSDIYRSLFAAGEFEVLAEIDAGSYSGKVFILRRKVLLN